MKINMFFPACETADGMNVMCVDMEGQAYILSDEKTWTPVTVAPPKENA